MSGRHRLGRWLGSGTAARSRTTTLATKSGWRAVDSVTTTGSLTESSASGLPTNTTSTADSPTKHSPIANLQEKLLVLAGQQEGLRRVATLVARGVSQSEVFSAVAAEMARCLDVENADVFRYEDRGATIVAVATFAEPGVPDHAVGERLSTEGDNISSTVWRTTRAVRMDSWESAAGSIAERVRVLGLGSRVGAPIVVDERVWGVAVVGNSHPDPLPLDTEERVAEFANLAATAIAAAATHAELIASRARIVAAADDARRRIERDLHDGARGKILLLPIELIPKRIHR
jgi:GAF domain-containing protein